MPRLPGRLDAVRMTVHQPEGMHEMADQGSTAQLRGPVAADDQAGGDETLNGKAGNGKVAKRDSDDIVAEIERTRQNLARTIDTLADRVSPASNVRRFRDEAAAQMAKPEVQLAALAVALAVTGITIYRIWGRRRS
jgi:Protein of unknown function (DUF3618)